MAHGMNVRLVAAAAATLFALTACGGEGDPASTGSASEKSRKDAGEKPGVESGAKDQPTEVGERLGGVDIVKKPVLVEATRKVKKYPDTEAGQVALTHAAARGCKAIKASGGDAAATRKAIRSWVEREALRDKDGKVVLIAAFVSVCPEVANLLPQG